LSIKSIGMTGCAVYSRLPGLHRRLPVPIPSCAAGRESSNGFIRPWMGGMIYRPVGLLDYVE